MAEKRERKPKVFLVENIISGGKVLVIAASENDVVRHLASSRYQITKPGQVEQALLQGDGVRVEMANDASLDDGEEPVKAGLDSSED